MKSSALVLEEVQAEIQARVALAENAVRQTADAEKVAALNDAQRLALARLVRAELATEVNKGNRRNLWQGIAVNVVFFLLGVLATALGAAWFR